MGESPRTDNPRIEELRRRVQADPASIAFAALAEEYRRVGNFDEAIETCLAGLKRHPSYLSAHVTLGRALIEVGRFDEAEQELQTVLKAAPENLAAIRGMAEIHHRRRDHVYDAEARDLSALPVHDEAAHAEHAAPVPPAVDVPGAYESPAFQAPAFEAPAYEPPAYEPPAYETPAYETPAYDASSFADPSPPPADEPPKYEPPVYEPPRYDPPGTFELPDFASAPHAFAPAAILDDRSAEIDALERFLAAVIAARASVRAR